MKGNIYRLNVLIILILLGCNSREPDQPGQRVDVYISNALIVDGTGSKPFRGNVAVADGKILSISADPIPDSDIKRTIDAQGRIVSPGFIDMHSHGRPEKTPEFENFLAMGVTTIVLGQDGSSPQVYNLEDWMMEVGKEGFGPNIVMFVGHGTLRDLAGISTEQVSPQQMDSIQRILQKQLTVTFGMSTGLEYSPGLYASGDELISLAKIVGENGKMIMSHMRNEDDTALFSSIRELADQGKFCQIHISHLKSVYGKGAERAAEILDLLHDIRTSGIPITADLYPYTASYTGISILFPDWSKTSEQFEMAKRNRRAELEEFLVNKVTSRNGPEATLFGTLPYAGKTLADLESEMGIPFQDILIDSIGPQGVAAAYFVMDETLQESLLKDSLIAICSDGSPTGFHPRGHGTFARIIETFVVDRQILPVEEAVRKMTSYPADILGLRDRGRITPGNVADLIIFDPLKVKETADYQNPFELATGFDFVIVNGEIARENDHIVLPLKGNFLLPENK